MERRRTMNPIIKYRGGKSKEIPSFSAYIPEEYDTYYEPFVGGGAVFFHLQPERAVIGDVNEKVINFYRELQGNYQVAREQLDELQTLYEANRREFDRLKTLTPDDRVLDNNEELYYRIRDMFNHRIPSEYLDAVIYYFINKTAYSGMIRYG